MSSLICSADTEDTSATSGHWLGVAVSSPIHVIAHLVQEIAAHELPLVDPILQASNCSILELVSHWTNHVLWGIVSVPSIRAYMTLPFAYGADYQIYYFLCLLKSVGEDARGCLCWPVSKSLPSFDAACSLEEMHRLRDKYRALCLARMAAFCGVSTTTAQMLKS